MCFTQYRIMKALKAYMYIWSLMRPWRRQRSFNNRASASLSSRFMYGFRMMPLGKDWISVGKDRQGIHQWKLCRLFMIFSLATIFSIVKVSNLFIHATVDFTVFLFLFLSFSGCSKQSIRWRGVVTTRVNSIFPEHVLWHEMSETLATWSFVSIRGNILVLLMFDVAEVVTNSAIEKLNVIFG